MRAALAYDQAIPPGTRVQVASENSKLLGLIIERAMRRPIQNLVSDLIWKPIRAADATYPLGRPGGSASIMCCMRARPGDWLRLGILLVQDGTWAGPQLLPRGRVRTMSTPSDRNSSFGLGLWRGNPYVAQRGYFEGRPGETIAQSEPFLADDVVSMEGGGNRVVFVVPSRQLVALRHGKSSHGWDQALMTH